MRKLAIALAFVFPVAGFSLLAETAAAKRKCPRGMKLAGKGKKCKRVKPVKKSSKSKRANGVSGSVGASTFSIAPSADGKSATFTVTINCTSADGVSITLSNGAGGKRLPFTAFVGPRQVPKFSTGILPETASSLRFGASTRPLRGSTGRSRGS